MDKPIWTVDQIASHLTRWQAAWDASAPIAYSFYETVPAHMGAQPSFTAFTLAQRQALADIFTLISDVAPLTFVNVADNGLKPGAGNERITFFNLNGSTIPFWGAASNFGTEPNGDQLGLIQGSEIVVNRYRADAQGDWGPGDSNPRKLMHEALHALGLAHPGDYNGDSALNYENEAEYQQDSHQYTVMSYWGANNTGADHTFGSITYYAATPLLHDVAALQALYGANLSTRTGDTVYGFNSTAGRAAFDINANPFPIFTIWDAAGIDTLDLSGFATASAIDLREGAFTDAGGLTDNISIAHGATIENAVGGAGDDGIVGNAVANRLDGGAGADVLQGLAGNDTYVVDVAGDSVVEALNEGSDTILSAIGYALGANVENLVLTGGAAIDGTGNDLANDLTGNAAANRLDGGAGVDTMRGGLGDDLYLADDSADIVVELAGEGTDTVESSASFALGDHVENLTLVGAAAIDGTGNGLSNSLAGNAAANRLDGGASPDVMAGAGGNDVYVVDDVADQVVELAGGGIDSVESSVSHTLGEEVEHLTLTGAAAISGAGNGLANILTGNGAANSLSGGGGADTMRGGGGDDSYVIDDAGDAVEESSGNGKDLVRSSVTFALGANLEKLTLTGAAAIDATGNSLNNFLVGNGAANVLDGGAGADAMAGGAGNDWYVVDNAGDRASENSNEGTDTVQSSVSFSLGAHVENLILTGAAAIDGNGNSIANAITGNSAANLINGGGGADTMTGGNGNDIYIVDNVGDQVVELAAGGTDFVKSSVTFILGANVEKLTLRGGAAIDGTGNDLANTVAGNEAANTLDGGMGADRMIGAGGNDTYIVDNIADQAIETSSGGGTDTVLSAVAFTLGDHVERLTLTGGAATNGTGNDLANLLAGNASANVLDGGAGSDTLQGGGGDDTLRGGLGNDSLQGDAGADDLVFDKPLGATNIDHILDFVAGSDDIVLENAVFKGIAAGGLNPNALRIGSAAADADDRIVYDPATGKLFYDSDGVGGVAQIQFAMLDNKPASLAAGDFAVI